MLFIEDKQLNFPHSLPLPLLAGLTSGKSAGQTDQWALAVRETPFYSWRRQNWVPPPSLARLVEKGIGFCRGLQLSRKRRTVPRAGLVHVLASGGFAAEEIMPPSGVPKGNGPNGVHHELEENLSQMSQQSETFQSLDPINSQISLANMSQDNFVEVRRKMRRFGARHTPFPAGNANFCCAVLQMIVCSCACTSQRTACCSLLTHPCHCWAHFLNAADSPRSYQLGDTE